ncbi:MAG: 23S rRNA (adenine(2503)-C(2))-methyltransferase RlmN [Candidatus Delongbacteria bacterium]|nr:23S rRNA (adenine(2503)-C(2))-methyltransferase RlmN [Candidatus Delongbacteria bacterium]MCG2759614.1 23S rRNA (adenine(2503)-C(2))-methyltransferase RlmN [Candidatus Delongbacteria bacterium]
MINYITGYRFDELNILIQDLGGKKYTAKQIWNWLYKKSVYNIELMTDIPVGLRIKLQEYFTISPIKIEDSQKSSDGTIKLLLKLYDDNLIECVIIPEKNRLTLCVSSQVGCRFNCSFCSTGKIGFKRNLSAGEIVYQVLISSDYFGKRITNVVYMGMGEPFDNYDEVIKSADILSDDSGLAIGKRKITISSFGHTDNIRRYTEEDIRYKLAISLHNPFDEERNAIMPINKKYGLKELFDALKIYAKKSNRKVVFEYVMIKYFNDSERHAKELIKLLSLLPSKLNLIKYHFNSESKEFTSVGEDSAQKFCNYFNNADFPVVFRTSRGEDISAACGQLSAKNNERVLI